MCGVNAEKRKIKDDLTPGKDAADWLDPWEEERKFRPPILPAHWAGRGWTLFAGGEALKKQIFWVKQR